MRTLNDSKLNRIIDANFNRAKEGLRVCEDIGRFILDQKKIASQFKDVRHQLTQIILALKISTLIEARDIQGDVGKQTIALESKRSNIADIFYANSQRVKESIRVLEEFSKLRSQTLSAKLKKLRYQIYALEKEVVEQL